MLLLLLLVWLLLLLWLLQHRQRVTQLSLDLLHLRERQVCVHTLRYTVSYQLLHTMSHMLLLHACALSAVTYSVRSLLDFAFQAVGHIFGSG